MNARALVLAAILASPGLALADAPPPGPAPPRTDRISPEDQEHCEWRCRTRSGCGDDDRCRVYRERVRERSGGAGEE